MANRTSKGALNIHGKDPQLLIEKIIRTRIYDSLYWKQDCFALTSGGVLEKATELEYIGGCYGSNDKPSPFICLLLKLLQLQPELDIVLEFINQEDFKYLRALGAIYFRLTHSKPDEIYQVLEKWFLDYRKLRQVMPDGSFMLICMDEFIEQLLSPNHDNRVCGIVMPIIPRRITLEDNGELLPRVSQLEKKKKESDTDTSSDDDSDSSSNDD